MLRLPAAPAPGTADTMLTPPPHRDPALDLLRSVALGRVVLWHLFAASWLTWFAAMPIMFFLAGALLPTPGQASHVSLVVRRCRRLLPPLWTYGAAVLAATVVHTGRIAVPDDPRDLLRALTWLVPVVDPADSAWHGGWLANHLWYLRAYLWVLLLAPIFAVLARRLWVGLPLLLLAVLQLETAAWLELPLLGSGEPRVVIGDTLTYGIFVVLGMAYRDRGRRVPSTPLIAVGAVASGIGAAAYVAAFGLPVGGINASYPAITLTGFAGLLALGALERPLRAVATRRAVRAVTSTVCRRAVTIYLWHPAAIVVAHAAVGGQQRPRPLVLAGLTLALGAVAALGAGWVEDLTSGRARWRVRSPFAHARLATLLAASATVLAVAVPVLVPLDDDSAEASTRPPLAPPSYRAALTNRAFAHGALAPATPFRLTGGRLPDRTLQKVVERWAAGRSDLDSVAVGLVVQGKAWSGHAARPGAGTVTTAGDRYRTASLTKTFTTALVLREVAAGRIGLDAPVPRLPGVGGPPRGTTITPRHLLQHTSGLVDYPLAPGYRDDKHLRAREAVALSLRAPLAGPPGAAVRYTNVNYLYLGLLLEHVTGQSYAELLSSMLAPLALHDVALQGVDPPGTVGFSSGGVFATVAELAAWGDALFTPGRVLPPEMVALLTTLDHHNMGLSIWPVCPCATDRSGTKRYTAIGQHVGHGGLYHFPNQMTLAVHVEPASEQAAAQYRSLAAALGNAFRR